MKVIIVAVSTVNGKLTRGEEANIYKWTSREDSEIFFSLIEKHNLIVLGGKALFSTIAGFLFIFLGYSLVRRNAKV